MPAVPLDRLLDFFAGSGTFGEAAARLGRDAVLIDNQPEAVEIMTRRLAFADPVQRGGKGISGQWSVVSGQAREE